MKDFITSAVLFINTLKISYENSILLNTPMLYGLILDKELHYLRISIQS